MAVMKFGGRLIRNLFSKPETRLYPSVPREYPERSRGHIEFDPSNCITCNICGKKCPTDAIKVDKGSRTLTIDRMNCIQCGYCVESCPKKCLSILPGYTAPGTEKVIETFRSNRRSARTSFPHHILAPAIGFRTTGVLSANPQNSASF